MADVTTGLVIGKYAPLHAGHQLVIETALAEVDHLIAVVYAAPSHTSVLLNVRADWIRRLYPEVELIQAPDGQEQTGLQPEVIDLQNGFLLRLLAGRRIDAFYSSEAYGEYVCSALHCRNRLIAPDRTKWAVSGSAIREALSRLPLAAAGGASKAATRPGSNRDAANGTVADIPIGSAARLLTEALPTCVRADILPRVVLLGAPSTGKTTTAAALARTLDEPLCAEYGREYWFRNQQNHRLSMSDLESIAAEQVRRDREMAAHAQRVLVADTSPLTTLTYARYYHGTVSALLEHIAASYHARDHFLVLCDTDIPFDDSWDRSGPGSRERLQDITREELRRRGLQYVLASGPTESRVTTILTSLTEWRYRC